MAKGPNPLEIVPWVTMGLGAVAAMGSAFVGLVTVLVGGGIKVYQIHQQQKAMLMQLQMAQLSGQPFSMPQPMLQMPPQAQPPQPGMFAMPMQPGMFPVPPYPNVVSMQPPVAQPAVPITVPPNNGGNTGA